MIKKIVIACDSFKGCLSSKEVASAVAEGISRVIPDIKWTGREKDKNEKTGNNTFKTEVATLEVADGGEGTAEILTTALGGETAEALVADPLGRRITAKYGIINAGHSGEDAAVAKTDSSETELSAKIRNLSKSLRQTAIIDMAQASGLTLLSKNERNPLKTSTFGTGEMILDALDKGCRRFLIGIGGSATNDGGTGMLEALGFKFTDYEGNEIKRCCGGRLADIAEIDDRNVPQEILESEFIVACDVNTPFCGEEGASRIFARQKGAGEEAIETLEKGMQSFAQVISNKYGIKLNEISGAGAAGGLGGAFKAFLNAELKSGIDIILDTIRFDEIIKGASLVITGEGKIDFQSSKGKVIDGICRRCRAKNIPVLAIAGIIDNICQAGNIDNCHHTGIIGHSSHTGDRLTGKEGEKNTYTSQNGKDSQKDKHLTVLPIGPEPQNESDLEYAMRPEVARRNISDTIHKILPEFL